MVSEDWRKPVPADFVAKVLNNEVSGVARSQGRFPQEIPPWWMAEAIQLYYAGVVSKAGFLVLIKAGFDDLTKVSQLN